ncbi:unnamed protein product [Closterium sp. NIES-54]
MAGAALIVGDDEESDYNECAYMFFFPVEMPGEPATLKEALESSDAEEWKKAMESELKSIEETRTKIERYKSMLVAKGYQKKEKVDYKDLFALVVKPTTLRTLLAGVAIKGWLVKHMDVTTAFLNGVLEENIFMEQPEGFDDGIGRVLKLKKALYGLNQAPSQWYLKLRGVLEEIGFTPSTADHSLFMLGEVEQSGFMVVYVDDILIFSPSSYLVKEVMLKLQDKFKCKALGDVSFYLGLHIERDVEKRCMRVHQRKYLEALAAKFGQSEGHVATPFPSGFKCVKEPEEESVGEEERRRFHSLVGSLMYAAVNTRPDVAFATGKLARVVQCPNEEHVAAGMSVAKYLCQTATVGLQYSAAAQRRQKGADGVEPGHSFLTAFSDASYASGHENCWRNHLLCCFETLRGWRQCGTVPHHCTSTLGTLHMDVWGPARVRGQGHERYFLLVVDDYSRYTTVFPLRSKGDVTEVLIDWIRAARLQLRESFSSDFPVLRLHSDRGGEFSSARLGAFCRARGIRQTFTLPASPQQNGIAERRIGMVMDVARTSMIHAAAPHFLWPFAVQYAAHQLNLQPRVSLPETSPTLRWTGKVGDASAFRVWGSRAFVRDLSADKLSPRVVPCVFLGFPPDAPGWQFYHPTSRHVLSSQDVTFDESGPAPSGVSQVDAVEPVEVAGDSGGGSGGAEPGGAGSWGAEPGGAESGGAEPEGAEPGGAEPGSAEPGGEEPGGAGSTRVASRSASRAAGDGVTPGAARTGGAPAATGVGPAGASGAAGAGAVSGVGAVVCSAGGTAGAAGGTGAAGPAGVGATVPSGAPGAGAAEGVSVGGSPDANSSAGAGVDAVGAGGAAGTSIAGGGTGTFPAGSGDPARPRPYFVPLLEQILGLPPSRGPAPSLECPQPVQSQSLFQTLSPLPAPSPYNGPTGGLAERREPASRLASPFCAARTSGRSDSLRASIPTVARLLSTVVTNPSFASAAASALVAELVDFAACCRLDYAAGLVAESASVCPPSVGGECALSTDVLEDRQEEFQCFAATLPHLLSMLIAPEGDPDAPDIPTPRSYAEAIEGPYSSQWQSAMDAEMASWKSTGTYVDDVPPPGANIGSLHEEIWLRCPPGFTGSFPPGTQWSLRRPVYGLRQAPYEWHDTLRTTLAALGFAPSTADPSLFLRTDTSLPPFYILVYVDDLVFATADTAGLAHMKSKLQKRHTCTDLGELRSYLGLQITRDRAQRTITLTQSHMVQQVLQRFDFTYSSPQATPLSTRHSLSALPSDESVESSGPYPELVGCLMYLMTCTRPDLAYPLSILARYVAPGRHRPEHMAAVKRVLRYLCSTSGLGLVLGGRRPVVLTGHADASWANDQATQRSSQGYTFSLGWR